MKKRNSNIELLRIIVMFMIVINHVVTYSGIGRSWDSEYFNRTISYVVQLGKVAVSCFILITGYFQINSKFKINKLLNLWLILEFYSIGLYLFSVAIGQRVFDWEIFFVNALPIINRRYWFINNYLALYIFSPGLNIMIKNFTRKQHRNACLVLIAMFSLIPTVLETNVWGNANIIWFVIMYIVGAYIRLYPESKWFTLKVGLIGSIVSYTFITGWKVVTDYLTMSDSSYKEYINYVNDSAMKFPAFLLALSMLILFININIPNIKFINWIASSTLAVYIIHDNAYMRKFLWEDTFRAAEQYGNPKYLLYITLVAGIVFCGCILIDKVRGLIFKGVGIAITKVKTQKA